MTVIDNFQEYHIDLTKMHEYLPWGGLLYPQVVRNKDGSLMGFIEYTTIRDDIPDAVGKEKIDEFPRGWALWIEQQHFEGEYQRVITLLWQPHIDKKNQRVLNTLDDRPLLEPETGKYFVRVLKDLCTDLSATVFAQILTGEYIFSYLQSTLAGKFCHTDYLQDKKEPLYLDAVLSRDIEFTVFGNKTEKKNDIEINSHLISIVTPLGYPDMAVLGTLFKAFRDMDYRFVRRFIFVDEETAKKEMKRYMKDWCMGRSSVREFMKKHLINQFNGTYTNSFIFHFTEEEREEKEEYIGRVFEAIGQTYILENYSRKQCWWGSILGIHRANQIIPLQGVDRLGDLLVFTEEEYV